ncbi:MAG: phosphoribosylamine--glycine ligase [Hyphomonas sp.]|jgi:phosphoribosylamine--glycine ligase|uniref:phosphoribosylamine--glycine ligase n=1 Tax=hydrothermal vent metagenome TaxID=652676 RepID=A0A160U1I4_9ZZZZ|nr:MULTISPECIES: phosphoribosylamine--glycine ligase [unclassified Hyphomonas]MAN90173.1 phosphoribosylamine--glycine ligase [Hyphomonadaceae bacterium]MAA81449.1 phosphoribosylamine--glycine ligase [Hyphomonas sp.]MBO6582645.1 phosphoribosylamine--glycine ligase [Hyphomonas sp.]MDF1806411.1 phosphoribosylamine--glycine ligase [Hyphomonas sp.]QSR21901.1 phosphoribosylamine--glycine ligase [Hyphomonas sp. KY3]|tara:strand:- start:2325 stop:3614 length:1290 start_codon:yes stop_codon:yes gene_type:complete
MNILLIGSGGREHALAWKMAQSPLVDMVHSTPGNPGMDEEGPCFDVAVTDIQKLVQLTLQVEPDLIVIGPEAPLAEGLSDILRARGFDVFGPSQQAAQLESSKAFSKARMVQYGVPTAAYGEFTDPVLAKSYLRTLEAPYVLKADGLAAGKGVVIAETLDQADAEIDEMLSGKFGDASATLVIEEFMHGEEASIFVITDGTGAIYLPAAQDHKRAGDGDTGPNTGGMGAYAPAPVVTDEILARVKAEIVQPMLKGMKADGMPYQGVLYVGIMVTTDGPKVVEFNARFGDPECQVLMKGLAGDIVPAILGAATGGLEGNEEAFEALLELDRFEPTATIVLATEGYPGSYAKGSVIRGVKSANDLPGVTVFQAGTDMDEGGALVANGGRVLAVTASGDDLQEAVTRAYAGVDAIDWPEGFCRRDIGWRALK